MYIMINGDFEVSLSLVMCPWSFELQSCTFDVLITVTAVIIMFCLHAGHEPHQLIRHHSRPPVCFICSPVLWSRSWPSCTWSTTCQRDDRTTTDAKRFPLVWGRVFWSGTSNPPLLTLHWALPCVLPVLFCCTVYNETCLLPLVL